MALKPKTIYKGTPGLDNILDYHRQYFNPDTGLIALQEAQNMDVDNSFGLSSRNGQEPMSTETSHSAFCAGGESYVAFDKISDTEIHQITDDGIVEAATVSDLTKGEYISYCQAGNMILYLNGFQNGLLYNGVRYAWPTNAYPTVVNRADQTKVYSSAPVGYLVAYHNGCAWIAIEEDGIHTIYRSLLYKLGTFRLSKYFIMMSSKVRMICSVAGGLWISDSNHTAFIAISQLWKDNKYTEKSSFPAHAGSLNQRLVDLSKSYLKIPGLCAIWSSDEGLCIGTPDGQLIIDTKEKLIYPTGSSGATVVENLNVINSVA